MKINRDTVATFHYRLFDGDKALENSHGDEPMAYLHGHNNIMAGLEEAMLDKEEGNEFSVTIPAEKAYGLRKANSVQRVPIKHLHNAKQLKNKMKPGMVVHINTESGAKQVVVVKVGRFNVDVDTNHPLAGKELRFEIKIESVRVASDEEKAHGHAHGVGGHQH